MASIDKLLPRSLNQDDDERLITSTQMTDAQNIRVSVDSNEDALILKNAWGNTHRSATIENGSMPAGQNTTIGSVGDDSSAQVYYFVYNNQGNHTILRHDQNAKKTYIVYQDEVLNFSKEGFVKADIVKLSNGNILLYFNDSTSDPKKINATLAEQSISGAGGYPATFSSGTIQQRTNYILWQSSHRYHLQRLPSRETMITHRTTSLKRTFSSRTNTSTTMESKVHSARTRNLRYLSRS